MSTVDILKQLCKDRGITVAELERTLDFGANSIYRWNKNMPSIDKLQKVAVYFDVSVDYLLGRTKNRYLEFIREDEKEKSEKLTEIVNKIKGLSSSQLKDFSQMIDPILKMIKK